MSRHAIETTHNTRMGVARRPFVLVVLLAVCAALVLPVAVWAQTKKPISKKGLINAVKINGLTTRELVHEIETRGVDFELTSASESEIRGAGARPEIVEAARANYRPAVVRPVSSAGVAARPAVSTSNNSSGVSAAPVPTGPPLSKDAIVELLRNGVPAERVERNVEARGVTFSMTPDIAREIKAAGGTNALVGAITEKAQAPESNGNNSGPTSGVAAGPESGPSYEDLIESASTAYLAGDISSAANYIQQAAKLDDRQPTAYQLIGLWLLNAGELASAEQALRAAVDRNGSAPFKVAHDHDGGFSDYCVGSFFVSKTGVSYVADNGRHSFEIADSNIKEIKKNGFVGAAIGAFHVKPTVKVRDNDNKERDNFNLAPVSQNKAVSDLIVRLAQSY